MENNISVSVLDAKNIPNFLNNIKTIIEDKQLSKLNYFSYIIHFDIMDGKFVPSDGIDLKYIKTAKNLGFYADTHLIVENPIGDKYIENAIDYGTDAITIHYEINNFEVILNYLNKKKEELKKYNNRELTIGVSIKPETDVNVLEKYKDKFTKILIMSVEPGYGGQKFINNTLEKITEAEKIFTNHIIQVDGGINDTNIEMLLRNKVESIVIGSYLSKTNNIEELKSQILKLNIIKTIENIEKNSNIEFDTKLLQILPGGYGEGDILIGITVPNIRKAADKWYKYISLSELNTFITSKYHEYRRFAIFVLSNIAKKAVIKNDVITLESVNKYLQNNLKYINNWDLTDEAGPNIFGMYLLLLDDKLKLEKITEYISNECMWIKRIGIVSLLTLVRNKETQISLKICDMMIYEEYNLLNKAVGWVLREIYKKEPMIIVEYLQKKNKEKKVPAIILSYACEKMSIKEKKLIKEEM